MLIVAMRAVSAYALPVRNNATRGLPWRFQMRHFPGMYLTYQIHAEGSMATGHQAA